MQKVTECKGVNLNEREHFIKLCHNRYVAAMERKRKTQSYFLNFKKVSSKLKMQRKWNPQGRARFQLRTM